MYEANPLSVLGSGVLFPQVGPPGSRSSPTFPLNINVETNNRLDINLNFHHKTKSEYLSKYLY